MKNSQISASEARLQQDMVKFYRNSFCLEHHVPRSVILAIPNENAPRLVAIGLLPGASDLICIDVPFVGCKPHIAFVEVKTPKGIQSENQKKFQRLVESMGFQYVIVRTQEEFIKLVTTWRTRK